MSTRPSSLEHATPGPFWGRSASGTLWGRVAAGAVAGTLAGAAQAAPVTISDITSSEPGLFTGATLSADGTRVEVNFAEFAARAPVDVSTGTSTPPITQPFASAFDTISFRLTAAPGWFFTTLDYREGLEGTATGGGFAFGTGSFTYNGNSVSLSNFMVLSGSGNGQTQGSLFTSPIITLGPDMTTLNITITNSLFAGAFGVNASATIRKTSAELTIGTQYIPVPAAAWLFASALVGLAAIGRRGSLA
jgi:hypothetical protein